MLQVSNAIKYGFTSPNRFISSCNYKDNIKHLILSVTLISCQMATSDLVTVSQPARLRGSLNGVVLVYSSLVPDRQPSVEFHLWKCRASWKLPTYRYFKFLQYRISYNLSSVKIKKFSPFINKSDENYTQ